MVANGGPSTQERNAALERVQNPQLCFRQSVVSSPFAGYRNFPRYRLIFFNFLYLIIEARTVAVLAEKAKCYLSHKPLPLSQRIFAVFSRKKWFFGVEYRCRCTGAVFLSFWKMPCRSFDRNNKLVLLNLVRSYLQLDYYIFFLCETLTAFVEYSLYYSVPFGGCFFFLFLINLPSLLTLNQLSSAFDGDGRLSTGAGLHFLQKPQTPRWRFR